jgi:hypothetical protein
MSIAIGGAPPELAAQATSADLGVAVAKKVLDQQELQGQAAVQLIQQAGAVAQTSDDPNLGQSVNRYA